MSAKQRRQPAHPAMPDVTYQLFVLALSLLAIANLPLELFAPDDTVREVVRVIDRLLSCVFAADFVFRLLTTPSRPTYMLRQYGWADLLSSVPVPGFKLFRLFCVVRVTRGLRSYGVRNLGRHYLAGTALSALLTVVFLLVCVVEFGSIGVIQAERRSRDANILTASDALWWSYVSITTVGYGDRFPVTTAGRLIGVLMLTAGVGLFAVLTGYLTNVFFAKHQAGPAPMPESSSGTAQTVDTLWRVLAQHERIARELRAALERLDAAGTIEHTTAGEEERKELDESKRRRAT